MRTLSTAMLAMATASVAAAPPDAPLPDIEIGATLRADSVTFHSPPRVHVELTGTPGRRDVDEDWRDNLPGEILPGRTYRDIGYRLEISTTLDPGAFELDVQPLPTTDEDLP